jgi:hypothetical protein
MSHVGVDRCPVVDEDGRVTGFIISNVRGLRSYVP